MADEEARERARKRLEERSARRNASTGGAQQNHQHSASPSRTDSGQSAPRASRNATPVHTSLPARIVETVSTAAQTVVATVGIKRLLIALAVLVALILAAVGVRSCAGCTANQNEQPQEEAPVQPKEQTSQDSIDQVALSTILGDDLTTQLVQAAETDDNAAWIAAHPQSYTVDGSAVQYKLLKLAAVEPEARSFVRGFPDAYPADKAEATPEAQQGEVPRLYQWDSRWGYTVYSSTTFALTGCCPTALAMVYQGVTGKSDLSPYDMGLKAEAGGYMTSFDGTDSSFLTNEAASLGLSCTSVAVDASSLHQALQEKSVVICNVGPGDFTDNGHFFVITGIAADGTLTINDPYSAERSHRTWDANQIIGQTKALWAYRAA